MVTAIHTETGETWRLREIDGIVVAHPHHPDLDNHPAPMFAGNDAWAPTHRHFKGGEYRVLAIAITFMGTERFVVYQGHDGRVWLRPEPMFDEEVAPGVKRFAPIGA